MCILKSFIFFTHFFFNDTAATEIYTLSLHDALPICSTGLEARISSHRQEGSIRAAAAQASAHSCSSLGLKDRKSTRLNSSHMSISYAVFCLKKKKSNTLLKDSAISFVLHSYHLANPP